MTIFKAYDIRGAYPQEINEDVACRIGRAFVTFTGTRDVMIGVDARTHSPALRDAFVRGCLDQGADVTDIGLITTSQMISLRTWAGHDTAVMVTASHLDGHMNGFKMLTGTGQYISEGYGMRDVEALVTGNVFGAPAKRGEFKHADYLDMYITRLAAIAPHPALARPFVVDCSNGSAGQEVAALARASGLPLIAINAEPDGTFPNHSPNPIAPGATDMVTAAIREHDALGGCVLDADADRVVFIDEKGQMVHPNYTACILITRILKAHPGSVVAYDLISSRAVPETIRRAGGKAFRTKVGRANVIDEMMKHDAIFGCESSSHYMFRETNYGEATSLAILYVIEALAEAGKPLSELVRPFATYALAPETNYTIADATGAMRALEQAFPEATIDHLDGTCLTFPDGWIVARASNTEPLLRLRAEANTPEVLARRLARAEAVIAKTGGTLATSGH